MQNLYTKICCARNMHSLRPALPATLRSCTARARRVSHRPTCSLAFHLRDLEVDTRAARLCRGVGVLDITDLLRSAVGDAGFVDGLCTVTSKHTTPAVVVNEGEARLFDDIQAFLLRLAPPDPTTVYRHNDINLRRDLLKQRGYIDIFIF